jgi:uncharacterized membrane protein
MSDATPAGRRSESARTMHAAFEISLFAKAAFAVLEIAGGVGACLVPQAVLLRLVERIGREELLEGHRDFITHHLVAWAQGFSISTRHFTAVYLLAHGVIKLWLVIGLLRGKMSYYPIAIAIFGTFIVYQLYRFHFTHSIWLIVITVIDAVVIFLAACEYRQLLKRRPAIEGHRHHTFI